MIMFLPSFFYFFEISFFRLKLYFFLTDLSKYTKGRPVTSSNVEFCDCVVAFADLKLQETFVIVSLTVAPAHWVQLPGASWIEIDWIRIMC
jgi:hypothetical protein